MPPLYPDPPRLIRGRRPREPVPATRSSSLYHHFGSRQGLLNAAQDESYRRLARREDRGNLDGGLTATTTEEFLDYVAAQVERIVTGSFQVTSHGVAREP